MFKNQIIVCIIVKSSMAKFLLSVVIPSYNEMVNLQKGILDKIKTYLEKNRDKYFYEVIICDDGSNDGSYEFAVRFSKENANFKVSSNQHLGKAGAVTRGMLSARGDYILFTDMDQAAPIEELDKLLPYFNQGYDVVIGSRSSQRKGAPLSRLVMARGMMILRSIFVGLPQIKDTQCGFKMFSKKAAQDIFAKIEEVHNGFVRIERSSVTAGFDIELLYIAESMKYKIKEVPIQWLYVETRRVNPIKDSIEGLLDLLRIRINIAKGLYR